MRIVRVAAITAVLAVFAAPPALAQVELEITPFAGGTLFLADPPAQFALGRTMGTPLVVHGGSFENAWTLGMNVGFRVEDRWAVEGLFSWIPTKLSATSGLAGPEDVHGYMYGVTALRYFPLSPKVHPFMGVGVGGETFVYETLGLESETEFMGNVVGGLYFPVSDGIGLRLEARDCFARFNSGLASVNDAWENDLMLTMGMSFRTDLVR